MQQLRFISTLLVSVAFLFCSCSDNKKSGSNSLNDKKKELAQLIAQKTKLEESINALQNEISKSDSGNSSSSNSKLIAVSDVAVQKFEHLY